MHLESFNGTRQRVGENKGAGQGRGGNVCPGTAGPGTAEQAIREHGLQGPEPGGAGSWGSTAIGGAHSHQTRFHDVETGGAPSSSLVTSPQLRSPLRFLE